ncbi:translocation/assembly module TamB domain-containing protein [Maritalea porphyrae]|uniref:DUF490 domain-containing protein n=1 Tax=Maritalea porphyrae TaxID=880732 RepID=A0ABQ5URY8_9HYPH|nr:translocation/assembly module TamB domain-containing protein [Maritalea porphyrae]GLQ17866.1 DUF490 domain-containing protein [Maritalea porphyrae]
MQILPSLIKRVALFCASLLLLSGIAAAFLLATPPGRDVTANLINNLASNDTQQVQIRGLHSLLGNQIVVEKVTLSDADGTWATGQDIVIDYSLLDMVFGRLELQKASIQQLEVARLPIAQPVSPSQRFDWPKSLLPAPLRSASIEGLEIGELILGEVFVGHPATFTISGELNAANQPLQTDGAISFQQTDGDGAFEASWQFSPAAETTSLSFQLNDGKDGVFAKLLNIPDTPALDISLTGSGPPSSWKSDFAVSFNGKQVVDGGATLSLTNDLQSIEAQLSGQLAPLLPKSLLPLVAGNTDVVISARRDAGGNVTIDQATLTSALAQITTSGSFSPEQDRVDLMTDVRIGSDGEIVEFARQPGTVTRLGKVSLKASVLGTVREAVLQAQGHITELEEGSFGLQGASFDIQSPKLNLLEPKGTASLAAAIETIVTGDQTVDALLAGNLSIKSDLNIADRTMSISSLAIKNDVISSSLSGAYNLIDGAMQISSVSDINVATDNLIGKLLGGGPGTIIADLTIDGRGNLSAQKLEVESANLNANASGSLSADQLNLAGDLRLDDIGQFDPRLTGQLLVNAVADGARNNPNINVSLSGQNIAIANESLSDINGTISGTAFETLTAKLNAKYAGTPVSVAASTTADEDGTRKVDALRINIPGAEIVADLSFNSAGLVAGIADLQVFDLSELAPLLLQTGLSGSATGRLNVSAENGQQSIELDLTAPSLGYDTTTISNLQLEANISDLFGKPMPLISARAETIASAGQVLKNAELSVSTENGFWPTRFDASLNGSPILLRAMVSQNANETIIDVEKATTRYQGIAIENTKPAKAILSEGSVSISAPAISIDGANATLIGSISNNLDLDITLSQLPMSTVEKLARTGLAPSGQITARAKVAGSPSNPTITYQIDSSGLSGTPLRDAQLASLNINGAGKYNGDILTTQLTVSGGGLDISVSGDTNIANKRLGLAVKGNLPFSYVAQPLTNSGVVLSGTANLDATIGGSFDAPDYRGQVSTNGARFTEIASRIRVTDLTGVLAFNGDNATISSLEGRLGENGRLSARGSISLRPGDKLQSDLTLSVRNGNYSDGVLISADFDADLALVGRLAETGLISGQVSVTRADITIPAALPNVVSPVAVSHKNASQAVNAQSKALQPQQSGGSGPSMALDINVNAQNRIFVRGRGLDAELGGGLSIGGTTARPTAKGTIRMSRGRMEILTKRFDFDAGQITFAGPLDPTLNFSATTREAGSSYSILVSGPASSPEFSFASSPSLPQDQIVAKLFFGRSLTELSPLQLVQLASAVNTLNGAGTDGGLAGRLRSIAGLDDVDIKTNEQGETTLGIGGYLNERTYLNVEKGTGAGSGKVTIDLNITDNITARGETSEDGKTKAGVFFEQDY